MNSSLLRRLGFGFVLLCATIVAHPQEPASTPPAASMLAPAPAETSDKDDSSDREHSLDWDDSTDAHRHRHRSHHHDGNNVVSIGHDSRLSSAEKAESVVSILGSSTSEGDAEDVVSVLGNTRVTGPVHDNAVAVLGSVYVDSKVDGDVVAVFGGVELGPHAEIGGDVTSVLGTVRRDPAAVIHGGVQNVSADIFDDFNWLHIWIKHCLLYGRPLAFFPGLGWAWTLALGLLAFYVGLALLFRPGISRCVETIETRPGHTALAALLTMLLTPVLIILLCVTLIGIAAVPFIAVAVFCAALFGKAVILAWLGYRIIGRRPGPLGHPAFAVLVGGALALILYVIPVLGFLVYKLLGFFGMGAVVYTLILALTAHQAAKAARSQTPASSGAGPSRTPASSSAAPNSAASATAASAAAAAGAYTASAAPGSAAPDAASDAAYAATANTATPTAGAVPSPASAAMPRAGFWTRMGALFIDLLLISFGLSLLHPMGHVHLLVLAVYGAVMWKLRGSTVGGIIFGLHVVRLDGRPVDWETAIIRALGCFLSLAVVGLGFIWIAFDDEAQAWHDKIAGTVVVRLPKGTPLT